MPSSPRPLLVRIPQTLCTSTVHIAQGAKGPIRDRKQYQAVRIKRETPCGRSPIRRVDYLAEDADRTT